MNIEAILSSMLAIHIAGGTIALLSGLVAILSEKGSRPHRLAGKIYFIGMTAVFIGAVIVAVGHHKDFLLMVGFFSYYMTVRGYRVLFLKKLHQGQKSVFLDWVIIIISAIFMLTLLGWGVWALTIGTRMGIVGIIFGAIGSSFLFMDVKNFIRPPREKMHWWFTHIGSMGGSYIAAITAFIVVNIQLPQYQWVLWLLPTLVGSVLISRSIRKYKLKFSAPI